MFGQGSVLRPCAIAFAVAMALGLSGCGGGGGSNIRPSPPPTDNPTPPADPDFDVDVDATTAWPDDHDGTGALTKGGDGTLVVTGTNTYTGGTTIDEGTLQIGDGGTTGSIVGDVANEGSLVFNRSDDITFGGVVSGSGSLAQIGSGILSMTGANTYSGGTTVSGGTLEVAEGGALGTGSVTLDGASYNATLQVDKGVSLSNHIVMKGTNAFLNNYGTIGGDVDTAVGGPGGTYAAVVNQEGGSIKANGAAVSLKEGMVANYSGSTIEGGTLGVSLSHGGSVVNEDADSVIRSSEGIAVKITGSRGIVFNQDGGMITGGSAAIYLGNGGQITNRSGSTIETTGTATGSCQDTGNCSIFVPTDSDSPHSLSLFNAGTIIGNVQLDALARNSVSLTTGSSIQGDLDMGSNDASALVLNSAADTAQLYSHAVTGTTTFAGHLDKFGEGTWIIDSDELDAVDHTWIEEGGTLQVGAGSTQGSIGQGDINIYDGSLVFDRSDAVNFGGDIGGWGVEGSHTSLVQAGGGTLILTGRVYALDDITINSGTLQVGDGGKTGDISGNVTDNGTLVFNRSDDLNFDGIISGEGALVQQGAGKLILSGANTFSGGTIINGGTLEVAQSGAIGADVVTVDNSAGKKSMLLIDNDASINNRIVLENTATLDNRGTITSTGLYVVSGSSDATVINRADGIIRSTISGGEALAFYNASITNSGEIEGRGYGVMFAAGTLDNDGGRISVPDVDGTPSGEAVHMTLKGSIVNRNGGRIENLSTDGGSAIKTITGGSVENYGAGSVISSAGWVGVYLEGTGGVVRNGDGGAIFGADGGVLLNGLNELDNDGKGSVISGSGQQSAGVAVNGGGGIVNNSNGAVISSTGTNGQGVFLGGGEVDNSGKDSVIRAVSEGGTGVYVGSFGSIIDNHDGAIIEGYRTGVFFTHGGTMVNGIGSIIRATGTVAGDCYDTGSCAIFVAEDDDDPANSLGGALTMHNAGIIIGDIQMDSSAANIVTLVAGGSIEGDLLIGVNNLSTLTLIGENSVPQSYSDAVTGTTAFTGTLIKEGGGTWIIDSTDLSSVAETDINGGALQANNELAGNVNVAITGVLDGVPGVVGDLSNAGKVAAHGGDVVVGGDYNQGSTGILAVSLGSKLDVAGTAMLDGGTLRVTGADSGYVANTHTEVLTAGGSVDGTFDQLVKDTGVVFTSTTINYDANSVWLDTTGLDVTTAAKGGGVDYTPVSMGSAVRVQGAFEQLDNKIATGSLDSASSDFVQAAGQFQQSPDLYAAQASLESLSGQLHAASAGMVLQAIDAAGRALSDRLDDDEGPVDGQRHTWMRQLSQGGDMARNGFADVDYQLDGWLAGTDVRVGQHALAGFAFSQGSGMEQLAGRFDRNRSRNTEGMVYAGWTDDHWYAQGRVGMGQYRQRINRMLLLGTSYQGVWTQYDGRYNVAYGESGLRFDMGSARLTPFVDLEYDRVTRDGFAEQGAGGFGLKSGGQALSRWQGGLGLKLARQWQFAGGRSLGLDARAQWRRTLFADGAAFDASFVGLDEWRPLTGVGLSRRSAVFGLDLDARPSANSRFKLGYEYLAGDRGRGGVASARFSLAF